MRIPCRSTFSKLLLREHVMRKQFFNIEKIAPVFKDSFARFRRSDPLRLASSVAFFTIFALPPILIILIHMLGFVFSAEIVSGEFFEELSEIFGKAAASQVQVIFFNIETRDGHWLYTLTGIIFLCFVSTTLFIVVQRSINELWDIKLKPVNKRTQLLLMFKNRLVALAIIFCAGLLVLSSLISDALLVVLARYLAALVPEFYLSLLHWGSHFITAGVAMIWFAIVFKYLPDAFTAWRVVWVGAALTAILFEIGKMILGRLLVNSGLTSVYGAAGSLIILLLFIFYSAMILFYGASFTKAYATFSGTRIIPNAYATEFQIKDINT